MRKYCTPQDFKDAELILKSLCVETNCFADGKIIRARYLVAIDDDPTSAFYAAYVYHLIYQAYAYHPFVLCVGGKGPLSKYTNEKGESEGDRQNAFVWLWACRLLTSGYWTKEPIRGKIFLILF